MNKTKRNAWHKHLKKAHKQRDKAALARGAHIAGPQSAATTRPVARPTGTASRPMAPRP